MNDTRRVEKIFMASSRLLPEERAAFDSVVAAVEQNPHIGRSFRLEPIRWESHAFGAAGAEVNESIQDSVDFPSSLVVVVVCDDRIGEGTRGEYAQALRLLRLHGRPQVFLYVKRRDSAPPEIEEFREAAIRDGVIPKEYTDLADWAQMLTRDLTALLERQAQPEHEPPMEVRKRFLLSAWVNVSAAIGLVALCRFVRMPGGLSEPIVLLIMGGPILLVALSAWLAWNYTRLLTALGEAWRSPRWLDGESYRPFRGLVPRRALPAPANSSIPRMSAPAVFGLALAFFGGAVGVYNCVFEQMNRWEFAVGWKTVEDAKTKPLLRSDGSRIECTSDGGERPEASLCYVDRGRSRFDFVLRDPRVAAALNAERRNEKHAVLYIHAQDRFAKAGQPAFRNSIGPEVSMPLWPVAGAVAFLLVLAMGFASIVRLWRFPDEVARIKL